MALDEDQVHLVGANRDLLMGAGTRFDTQSAFNPFTTSVRTPQTQDRPYGHGALVGAEWMDERVVPIRVIANGATPDVPGTRAAVQDMSATFSAVAATGEIAELRFRLAEDPDEFVLFGRPRGIDADMDTLALGYSYVSTAFVASDPRIYSGDLSSQSTGLPLQQGGLTIPAVPASTRLRLPDVSGAYASTPNHASLQITGDLSLRFGGDLRSWTDGFQQLVTRYSTGALSYALNVDGSGIPRLQWSVDGSTVLTAPASTTLAGISRLLWLRADLDVDNGAAGRTISFFTGPTRSGPWTAFGTPVVQAGVTSVFAGPSGAALEVGSRSGGTTQTIRGAVEGAEVRNSAGTVVAAPDFTTQTVGATGFTDTAGRAWSVNGAAKLVGGSRYRGGVTAPLTVPGYLVGGEIALVNNGTTDTALKIRIDGPMPEPGIVLRRPDGTVQTLSFDLDLAEGQWLEIDTAAKTALLNGLASANQRGVAAWRIDPYPVQPGVNVLRLSSSAYNAVALVTASHRSAWW